MGLEEGGSLLLWLAAILMHAWAQFMIVQPVFSHVHPTFAASHADGALFLILFLVSTKERKSYYGAQPMG